MQRYIGLDVHASTCTAVVIGPSGRKIKEAVIETAPRPLIEFVRTVHSPRVLVMEECNQSSWLYEVLSPHADETRVIQPQTRPVARNKNDRSDAEWLARLARLNEPGRIVYKNPKLLTALRHATKSYQTTRTDLSRNRTRLKHLLLSRGLLPNSAELLNPDARAAWIERLPSPIQPRAALLGTQIDAAVLVHEKAETWMLAEAKNVRAVQWVKSVPGIGDVRAPLIVSVMISPHRFRTKRQLWRYAGLAVVHQSSSDWRYKGGQLSRRHGHELAVGLNRDRNSVLKDAFVGAAQQIISHMPSHPLHKGYRARVEGGMDPSNARLTLARKIAATVLTIWKRGEVYDPTKS